ncbi:sugar phosphate isomerase/epimerase family protein [Spongiivirga citrea]|uniref:TIM barrel protein n=1 Tax=Spongiivirga citrea TaxID=1481457 RepID=A0A6M0CQG7_9FLAO|nr:sugar phosphate isomerase/epimerase [Spongiivirga citrea]NER18264.1 TIM barrel protein [Spongiivirga citrea]
MNRRNFVKLSSAAGLASCLPISCLSMQSSTKFKLGYQLFSIRDEMAKDPIATLKALKKMGYQDFEHFGFDADKASYYGIPTKEFKKMLDDLELTFSSGHYPFSDYLLKSDDELKRYTDKCIKGALEMSSNYITWPWIAPSQRTVDGFKRLVSKLNMIGEQVSKAGLGFAYHNHGYEFDDLDGTTGYDIILNETDTSTVKLQLDMYWVMHSANATPRELIAKQPGRYVMWHIKDMHKTSRDYTELGNGSINYHDIMPDPTTSGLEFYYIEQGGNYTENSLKSAETSANYFKEQLAQYL